jgi:hypothetical protein
MAALVSGDVVKGPGVNSRGSPGVGVINMAFQNGTLTERR